MLGIKLGANRIDYPRVMQRRGPEDASNEKGSLRTEARRGRGEEGRGKEGRGRE